MGTTFRPYSPDQELLLPPSLNEWLPEGHLAYLSAATEDEVSQVVDGTKGIHGLIRKSDFKEVMENEKQQQ
ncbi:hypothetical protein MLC59_18815 [Marinobacter bryozoorum]|uniref:hypothetical protein n=1 Tax=Marinobacter bryozoorum TaxID=256324 RepID=UPI002004B69E|nr:hypothetical protein [Marinobacter bryozoorum]MCK7546211.1 hypothetical protein [Marinobacter bryozoorum]